MKLSKDVKRYIRRRFIIRVGGVIAWFLAWGLSIWQYAVMWSAEPDMRMIIFAAALSLIGIVIFDIPGLISRKTVDGVIVDRSVTEAFAPFTRGGDEESNRMIQTLKIKLDDGRVITHRCGNREQFIYVYKEGMRVRRHRLLRIPQPLEGDHVGRVCLICGGHPDHNGRCAICGKEIA